MKLQQTVLLVFSRKPRSSSFCMSKLSYGRQSARCKIWPSTKLSTNYSTNLQMWLQICVVFLLRWHQRVLNFVKLLSDRCSKFVWIALSGNSKTLSILPISVPVASTLQICAKRQTHTLYNIHTKFLTHRNAFWIKKD